MPAPRRLTRQTSQRPIRFARVSCPHAASQPSQQRRMEVILDKREARDLIPKLKKAGAEGIVEYPLNKVIY